MFIDKLSDGVLRVITPVGPRYIKPELSQRLYLLWIFRHFQILPLQVLSLRQQKLIDTLCAQHRFVSLPQAIGVEDAPILGTVESRPRVEVIEIPPRIPSGGIGAALARLAGGFHQRS